MLSQTQLASNSDLTTLPWHFATHRSIEDILLGINYLEESQTSIGDPRIDKQNIQIKQWWSGLDETIREQLKQLPIDYWPIKTLYKLSKLSLEKLESFINDFLSSLEEGRGLLLNQIDKLISKLNPRKSKTFELKRAITETDWEILALKLKFTTEQTDSLKEQFLNCTTDELLNYLESQKISIDPLLKPKDLVEWKTEKLLKVEKELEELRTQLLTIQSKEQASNKTNLPQEVNSEPIAISEQPTTSALKPPINRTKIPLKHLFNKAKTAPPKDKTKGFGFSPQPNYRHQYSH
ncbi:hypothetical protein [Chroococcus sp. FPU101]|uniref:hypothetical protein n=1 Tax=Chroococcus sp. FPU101 TaxID=1974212 RepID=UPI001A909034|nr:hypothetical protein [Chroococcus sp. FPU101]GFE69081.1 hypothetical protein CFPU101_16910 [Chroococcus sp. FPU101]